MAAEITAAVKIARARAAVLPEAQEAVRQALETYRRLDAASYGLSNPKENLLNTLEPLIAIQTLAGARTQYLNQVIEYNKAQFRLFTALGQPPEEALSKATSIPISLPVLPAKPNNQ